jgi:hypothetical protein
MVDVQTQAWLDQEDSKVAQTIRRYGWFIQYVGGGVCDVPGCDGGDDDGPPFAYTVGLFGMGHPELLIFGVSMNDAALVLNTLGRRIRVGTNLLPGELISVEDWPHRIVVEQVPNPGEIAFSANRHYWRPAEFSVPVLQLSYDDDAGRFPWEPNTQGPQIQPRPGTFRT